MRHVIFGESHGPAIGVTLTGLPSGLLLDMDQISFEMARRAPGKSELSTSRKEADIPEIISGIFEGRTTGSPLTAVIRNSNQHSNDYSVLKTHPRPGHGDYPGYVRYHGYNDYRGGGHFSGRLTAPLVFAGAVAKQILREKNIFVGAHIREIAGICDEEWRTNKTSLNEELFCILAHKSFPVINDLQGEAMQNAILTAKNSCDSVGGIIECSVIGVPAGFGEPDFGGNTESLIAQHMFAIPAVKGLEFGVGFSAAQMRGSEFNDPIRITGGGIYLETNNSGGVNGGITNGMPIIFSVVIRPTPSIYQKQNTVDLEIMENDTLTIEGRHDPCIVHRAVPVVEAGAALAICELLDKEL